MVLKKLFEHTNKRKFEFEVHEIMKSDDPGRTLEEFMRMGLNNPEEYAINEFLKTKTSKRHEKKETELKAVDEVK